MPKTIKKKGLLFIYVSNISMTTCITKNRLSMETNEKLIAVVEIGGGKSTQFWARADDLAQEYNEKSTDITYSVKKLPDSENLFRFFAASKEEMKQETLLECSREFLDELLTLVPSECVRISIAGAKEG